MDYVVKRRFRLTKSSDFQRVRLYGKSYAHPLLVLKTLPNESESLRIGIIVGRYSGNAVQRNHMKRLLRAAIHPYLGNMKSGWDVVLIPRRPMSKASFLWIDEAVKMLLERSGILGYDTVEKGS